MRIGQPAAFAISLFTISAVLFLTGRFLPPATVLLVLSLAAKPQIGGLAALYLVLRKMHPRHALVALGGTLPLLLISIWILRSHPAAQGGGPICARTLPDLSW